MTNTEQMQIYLGLIVKNLAFEVSDHAEHKPACSSTETSKIFDNSP